MLPDDYKVLKRAEKLIRTGEAKCVDMGHGTKIYKVPSNNPKKYIIRVDIKVNEEDEHE